MTADVSTDQLPFQVTSGGFLQLPAMNIGDTMGFIKDTYANPEGSAMCSGFFELFHTSEAMLYEYTYDEMKVVLEGELLLENRETGQTLTAKAKDAIFFPKGSKIYFSTPDRALAFYCGHRDASLL
jgi:ethanolamine utilization protein EutQ